MSDSPLARYQSALLAVLIRKDIDLETRLSILREDPAFAPYAEHIAAFDSAFIEQGVMVIQHWGSASARAGRSAVRRRGMKKATSG